MAYTPGLNGGRINASIAGNTTGLSSAAAVSTGTVVFAGGTNVTLSQSTGIGGATISFNAGGLQSLGMYGVGNTTQGSAATLDARSISLNGLGAMSVGYSGGSVQLSAPSVSSLSGAGIVSISTAGSNITLSAPAYSAGMSSLGNTSGTIGLATNQLVLAGGSNITLSQATGAGGNTLSIIGAAGGTGGGGGVALYDGTNSITSGTANIQAHGALTASITSQTLNLSVPAVSSLSGAGAVNISSAGSGITVSAPPNGTLSNWEPLPLQNAGLTTGSLGNASLHFFNLQPQAYVTATQLLQLASMAFNTAPGSSHAGTVSLMAGIFTASGSTLNLVAQSSGSASYAWANTSDSSVGALSGIRGLTLPMNVNMSPGNYWLGVWSSSASAGSAYSLMNMVSPATGAYSGQFGQAVNATKGVLGGVGYYSNSTAGLPASMPMSAIVQTNIGGNAAPYVAFINQTW